MYKEGCNVSNFATECLGDKILTFGGKTGKGATDEIRACNVNDCLSESKDIEWDTIGTLERPAANLAATRFKYKKTTKNN